MAKILLVGIDGLNLNTALESGLAPNLKSLHKKGFFTWLETAVPTLSGPSWSTLLTGATYSEHQVSDNLFLNHELNSFPDFLSLAANQNSEFKTFAAAGWPPLIDPAGIGPVIRQRVEDQRRGHHRLVVRDGETYGYIKIDAEIANFSNYYINRHGPHASFVYFCDVDDAGHIYGSEHEEYLSAIGRVDSYLGRLLMSVKERVEQHNEEWIVAVVTDHGHKPEGGHGGDSPAERQSFLMARGLGRKNPEWNEKIEPFHVAKLLLQELN